MKIIPPIVVTDAMVTSTNVLEGPAPDYDAGHAYAAGDMVSYAPLGSLLIDQWASLQNANTGHTPGMSGTYWSWCGQAAAPFDAGTTYAAGDGAQIDGGGVHELWWSVVDDNTGNAPAADAGDHWVAMAATNYWAMFDQGLGFTTLANTLTRVATRWGGLIDVTLAPTTPLDTVVAWVIDADSVRVTVTDTGAVVIYDETVDLTADVGLEKWQLDGIAHIRPVPFEDVVFTAGSHLRVRIAKPGGVAICAELVLGQSIDAGSTQWGARVGIQDYSSIQPDDFGTFQVTMRTWHRRASFDVHVEEADVDPLIALLTRRRGSPMQFIGQPTYRSACVFGFVRSFEETISWPGLTVLSIDLESI